MSVGGFRLREFGIVWTGWRALTWANIYIYTVFYINIDLIFCNPNWQMMNVLQNSQCLPLNCRVWRLIEKEIAVINKRESKTSSYSTAFAQLITRIKINPYILRLRLMLINASMCGYHTKYQHKKKIKPHLCERYPIVSFQTAFLLVFSAFTVLKDLVCLCRREPRSWISLFFLFLQKGMVLLPVWKPLMVIQITCRVVLRGHENKD